MCDAGVQDGPNELTPPEVESIVVKFGRRALAAAT